MPAASCAHRLCRVRTQPGGAHHTAGGRPRHTWAPINRHSSFPNLDTDLDTDLDTELTRKPLAKHNADVAISAALSAMAMNYTSPARLDHKCAGLSPKRLSSRAVYALWRSCSKNERTHYQKTTRFPCNPGAIAYVARQTPRQR
jgi:hypothetical protein